MPPGLPIAPRLTGASPARLHAARNDPSDVGDEGEDVQVVVDAAEPAPIVLIDRWVAPASRQRPTWSTSLPTPASVQVTRPSMPIVAGSRPARRGLVHDGAGLVELRAGRHLREPAVGQAPDAPVGRRDLPPIQIGIGRCTGSGAIPAPVTRLVRAVVGDGPLGPQPAQQLDLLLIRRPRSVNSCPAPRTRRRSSRARRRAGTGPR